MQIVLDRGQRADWFASPWVVWTSLLSAAALIVLTINELRIADPILDLRILKIKVFSVGLVLIVAMSSVLYGTGLLMPIFLQEFMGYTAWKAGLVLAPRGLATMMSMIVVGQIARRGVDTRPLVGVGFLLMTIGLWTMAGWNLQVSLWVVVIPSVVMGLGMGMIFPTLSATALSVVARERIGYAASLYNMMRNTGAAIGIAYMTTMLVDHEQIHQSRLAEHLSVFDAWKLSESAPGLPGAPSFQYLPQMISGQHQSFGMIYNTMQAQAAILSFNDIYRILAVVMALMIPGFLILRKAKRVSGPPSAAH
jgi:DHA2 family multidrug resistance protein